MPYGYFRHDSLKYDRIHGTVSASFSYSIGFILLLIKDLGFALTGEIAALTAAFLWACAAVLYRQLGVNISPLRLNLYKGVIAGSLLCFTINALSQQWSDADPGALLLLFWSGVIGIGVGDTAFFAALNRIGARHTVLIAETVAPAIGLVLAYVFLNEAVGVTTAAGIVITLAGVAWVILQRGNDSGFKAAHHSVGIPLALLAALSQSIGAILSRQALTQFDISVAMSTLTRLLGGLVLVILCMAFRRQPIFIPSLTSPRVIFYIFSATILGTYLGIYFQQMAFKNINTGIALTLLATSPLFVLLIAIARRERVTIRSVIGALIAVIGVGLLFIK